MEAHLIDIVGLLDDPWRLPLACLSSWAYRGIAACARADGRMEFASWESWEVAVVGLQGEGGTGRFVIVIVIVMPYRYRYRYRYRYALSASRKGWRRSALAMVDGGGGKNYKLK